MIRESKGNMYPGFETWNPIAGECYHKCGYCSTHSFLRYPVMKAKYSGPMRLDYKTLDKNLGKNKTWFVVAQSDLFAIEVKDCWISEVLNHCCKFDNTYLFQSKNPRRFFEFKDLFPSKTILCTTIETNRRYKQMGNTPYPVDRSHALFILSEFHKQITIEPIMDFDLPDLVNLIKQAKPNSVNIGR